MDRQPFIEGPSRTRCAESTMRSVSLSLVGAERTRTQVLAVANSQRPVSGTATLGGGAGTGAAGFGDTLLVASAVVADRGAAATAAGAGAGIDVGIGAIEAGAARSDESAAINAVESIGEVASVGSPVSATLTAGIDADFIFSVRREIRYPTARIMAMPTPVSIRPRTSRRPDGAVDIRQFGQTPMATGRCTPQLGQLTVATRSPPNS
jgi:hypothetical protein